MTFYGLADYRLTPGGLPRSSSHAPGKDLDLKTSHDLRRGKMKSIIIVAIVAALISAAAATATTTLLITSAQIKNGTIKLVDISPAAKRALRGQRGLRGSAGAPGAQGAQGPAGPGLSGLHYVEVRATAPPMQEGTAQAQCPSGELLISGGGATNVGSLDLTAPFAGTSWVVGAFNDSPTLTATVVADALCGRIG
jgi:hypothetical protein